MELILKYFPNISEKQIRQFEQAGELYREWNEKVNLISRKDIENLYEKHILHSLGIAMFVEFNEGDKIMDVGTGGGFPGIPLAILFPESNFYLIDSIGKKIKVVQDVAQRLGLENVRAEQTRVEEVTERFDFIVSRAVTDIKTFQFWVRDRFLESQNEFKNGILYLKGGDLKEELAAFKKFHRFYELSEVFEEEFFQTKKVVYVPAGR